LEVALLGSFISRLELAGTTAGIKENLKTQRAQRTDAEVAEKSL
jgi:hypothetical protein